MKSLGVALLSLLTGAVAAPPANAMGRFSADYTQPYVQCWIDQVHFTSNFYNASGRCQEFTSRSSNNAVAVPWSAVGQYDAAARQATETIRIVKGGLDIPSHAYYGTITAHLVCARDPWREGASDCGVDSVKTTETIPQYFVDDLVRNRRRPFTSDLNPQQRAALQQEYQAAVQRLHQMVQSRPGVPTGPSDVQRAMNAPIQIVTPQPGGSLSQGDVRVQIRAPIGVAPQTAEVELSWLPPRSTDPSNRAQPPAIRVKTWQAPLDRLVQGAVLPRSVTDAWLGPTLVRVRVAGARPGPWSEGVSFNLVSMAAQAAKTPLGTGALGAAARTTPDWSKAVQPSGTVAGSVHRTPSPRSLQNVPSGFGQSAPTQAPPSGLGSRP